MTSETQPAAIDHPIGPTGRLTVKVAGSDVRLIPAADDHVRVRTIDGRPLPDDYEIETEDGGLSVRQVNRLLGMTVAIGTGFGRSVALEIEVPESAETTIQTASGAITGTGLRGDQQYRSASGDVELTRGSGRITAETVSGDVGIVAEDAVDLIVKTVSGKVAVEGGRMERVRLTTTSGDIGLVGALGAGPHAIETLSGDALIGTNSGVRIQARTVSGDLRSDLPHTADGMMGRRSLTVGDGAVELSFRSVSGDLRVVDPLEARGRIRDTSDGHAMAVPPTVPTGSPASETSPDDDRRLEILRALERGEIDIDGAREQLALVDESTDA
jgi:DUF4097 and DUF4098 domain-containing protein YvlB